MKIHKGDDVIVLSGKFRGERANVEEALPGLQVKLATDEIELLFLGNLERRTVMRVNGAGVHHRGSEEPLVEPIGHVVVVADHSRVS